MFKLEYDKVCSWHPYRELQPSLLREMGGLMILHVDGVNCTREAGPQVHQMMVDLERRLIADCEAVGIEARSDNHHGFTVVIEQHGHLDRILHVRFSDGSMYLWLLPEVPNLVKFLASQQATGLA